MCTYVIQVLYAVYEERMLNERRLRAQGGGQQACAAVRQDRVTSERRAGALATFFVMKMSGSASDIGRVRESDNFGERSIH